MLKFTKRFHGSYFTLLSNGCEISIQSYTQYSGCADKDDDGNKWVMSLDCDYDWDNDHQYRSMTKKDCIAYANKMASEFNKLSKF